MRGQKGSIRSALANDPSDGEGMNTHKRLFTRPSEEDEEDEINYILTNRFRHQFLRKNSKKRRRNKSVKSILGIPMVDFIYYGPPFESSTIPIKKEKKAKYKIIRYKGKSYTAKKTLCSYIFKILAKKNTPLHVNDLILNLNKLGVLSDKTNHNYGIVYRTLKRNTQFFIKTEKATFSLRKGFKKWEKPEIANRVVEESDDFASLQQLVISIVKQISPTEMVSSPFDVFHHLKSFGFNGSYKSIYNAMHSTNFRKEGPFYRVINDK